MEKIINYVHLLYRKRAKLNLSITNFNYGPVSVLTDIIGQHVRN